MPCPYSTEHRVPFFTYARDDFVLYGQHTCCPLYPYTYLQTPSHHSSLPTCHFVSTRTGLSITPPSAVSVTMV